MVESPKMSTPGTPYVQNQSDIRILQRGERPDWLSTTNFTATLAILGSITYIALYQFDLSFLGEFGTSPEEVGVDRATLITRAAFIGTIMVILSAVAAGSALLWGGLLRNLLRAYCCARRVAPRWRFGLPVGRSGRASRDVDRVQRQTHILAASYALVATAATAALVGLATTSGGERLLLTFVVFFFYFAVFYLPFFLIAQWRHMVAMVAFVLILISLATVGADAAGTSVAHDVMRTGQTSVPMQRVFGLEVRSVCISWTMTGSLQGMQDGVLVYLGHADGVTLVTDTRTLYRIHDAQFRAIITPLPEDGFPAPKDLTCE
jgi:hypothetical protein